MFMIVAHQAQPAVRVLFGQSQETALVDQGDGMAKPPLVFHVKKLLALLKSGSAASEKPVRNFSAPRHHLV